MSINISRFRAVVALGAAELIWGTMAPIAGDAMRHGFSPLTLTDLRMWGGALCFWLFSLCMPREHVPFKDVLIMFAAGFFSILVNQGLFVYGLSRTSPIDASVICTLVPVLALVLLVIFFHERPNIKRVTGIFLGFAGACFMILYGNKNGTGSFIGDTLIFLAETSFACYLVFFQKIITRYHTYTLMKWMFLFSAVMMLPCAGSDLVHDFTVSYAVSVWLEVAFVVFFGTYVAYALLMIGQKKLKPAEVGVFNYMQPIISAILTVVMGLGIMTWSKAFGAAVIFTAVWLVIGNSSDNDK